MRMFAAVQPPPDVLDHLETALGVVRGGPAGRSPRWTPSDGRHITLAFYGEVPDGYHDDVARALDDVADVQVPFRAELRGAGLFSGRTLWIGCSGEGWVPLMRATGTIGARLMHRPVDHRSRPHLTVARVRDRARSGGGERAGLGEDAPGDAAALAHALALYAGPAWTVDEIVLMSSQLGAGPGGASLYDVVHRSALGPRA